MDHANARVERDHRTPAQTPASRPRPERSPEQDILELQRTAGNRAVAEALAPVQRHSLDPENMEQQP